jgi:hypothetical protein
MNVTVFGATGGAGPQGDLHAAREGTRTMVDAMRAEGVGRYIGMAIPSLSDPRDGSSLLGRLVPFMGRTFLKRSSAERKSSALRRRLVAFVSANDERDAREIHGGRVVCQELGESPGGESRRPNGVRISGCAEGEGDRQLVSADGSRAVPVIPAAEVTAQPVVDDLT